MASSKQKPNEAVDGKAARAKAALKKVTKQAPKPKPKSK